MYLCMLFGMDGAHCLDYNHFLPNRIIKTEKYNLTLAKF
jgi:hypothetical protein